MKVAYVLSRYPTLTETFIRAELQALLLAGVDLHIYPLRGDQNTAWIIKSLSDGGVSEHVRRFGFALLPANIMCTLGLALSDWGRFYRAVQLFWRTRPAGWRAGVKALFILPKACRIAVHMREWGGEHVHAHFANLPAAAAAFIGNLLEIPFSFTAHAFDIYGRDATSLNRLTTAAYFAVTISQRNRAYLAEGMNKDVAARIHVIHCGVDKSWFTGTGPADGPFVAIGRLVPKKGFHVLVEAMELLTQRGIDARCEIIGDGEQRRELERSIALRGLKDRVVLLGPLPPEKVRERLARARAFVLPCHKAPDGDMDGIPVSLMEAMAMQKLVVSTAVSGIMELVTNEQTGLLVPEKDPQALADTLESLLAGRIDAAAIGQRACAVVAAEFDSHRNAHSLLQLMTQHMNTGDSNGM